MNGWNNGLQALTYAQYLKPDTVGLFATRLDYQTYVIGIWQASDKSQPFADNLAASWPMWLRREVDLATDGKGIRSTAFAAQPTSDWKALETAYVARCETYVNAFYNRALAPAVTIKEV